MAMTPYPNFDDDYENPSILASTDGTTWVVPAGLTNPIDAQPVGGFNADTELEYDGSSTLYCYYIDAVGTTRRVLVRSSTNGTTWGSETQVLSLSTGTSAPVSPAVVKDGSTWKMWYVDTFDNPNTLVYRDSSSPDSGFSGPTDCTLPTITGRDIWHISVFKDGSTYRGLFTYCDSNMDGIDFDTVHLASSSDGLTWTVATDPILSPRPGFWDDRLIYRTCGVIDGTDLDTWYSVSDSSNVSHIARTRIPMSAFP